ncbi:sugar-transfer associated ATP-grasp domain-containing protein [Anaerobaca lacustris]|uniref:Sugar-transfer associated ATP-grasp domain-containing protein n=1 Tax=Anaerobaca lacustris TaxID=3044600 RepID=A0AAW6TVC0_9BACT|nr:sugar-transfer associated ATP-grasp domain-containing protein [Sedimentisphaerales bacterium M17dextr]
MFSYLRRIKTAFAYIRSQLKDPDALTYFPEAPRKAGWQIRLDFLRWMVRHREMNHFYYVYGLDRKGARQREYLANREFFTFRNSLNAPMDAAAQTGNHLLVLRDKFLFGQYLTSLGFPTPRTIALCDDGMVYWMDTHRWDSLESVCGSGREIDGFLKGLYGECGEAVSRIQVRQGRLLLNGREAGVEELRESMKGQYIIQERIAQHATLARLHPHSVNTIRLITIRTRQTTLPFSAGLRMGTRGNHRDNWATGGLFACVDLASGRLGEEAFYKPGFGGRARKHPDSGVIFADVTVPHFREAVDLAVSLHPLFHGVASIGWDIAIADEGPVFIEGNDNWEISLHQAHEGGLREAFHRCVMGYDSV